MRLIQNVLHLLSALLAIAIMALCPVNRACTQNLQIKWQASLGGTGTDKCFSIEMTSDNGYILAGQTSSTNGDVQSGNNGDTDCWMVKLDSSGIIEWEKALGGPDTDLAVAAWQNSDGSYIMAGKAFANGGFVNGHHGEYDFWVVKLNSSGDTVWTKSLGGAGTEEANAVRQTADGGFIIVGRTDSLSGDVSTHFGLDDFWVVKLDSGGNIEWEKSIGGTENDVAYSVIQTADNNYLVAGSTQSNDGFISGNHGNMDFWVVKLNPSGDTIWTKTFGGSQFDRAYSIKQTSDGGYVVAGQSSSTDGDASENNGMVDFWLVKLDPAGNIEWQRSAGSPGNELSFSVSLTEDGGYVMAGYTDSVGGDVSTNQGGSDYWVVKLNASGNLIWQKTLGGLDDDVGRSIVQNAKGEYVVAGYSGSNDGNVSGNQGGDDFWTANLSGCLSSVYGQVTYNSVPAADVFITSLRKRLLPGKWDSTQTVATNASGEFWLNDLDSGTYVIHAIPDHDALPSALPTYWGDVPFWLTAARQQLACAESDTIAIELLQLPPRAGNGKISGYLYFGSNKRADPIEDEDIVVAKVPPGSAAAFTTSDASGYYEVDSLDPGNYQVIVEVCGMNMVNNINLTVAGADTLYENVSFNVDTVAATIMPVSQAVGIISRTEARGSSIYPNPTKSEFTVSWESGEKPQVVELWNPQGEKMSSVYEIELDKIKFTTNHLQNGIYFLRLIFSDKVYTEKIIRQ